MIVPANATTEIRQQLKTMEAQFAAVLPKHVTPERFTRVVVTAIQNSPELVECDRRSLLNACMRAATDGLLPDGRLGAIVVFRDRKRNIKTAQWMPMIAGLRQKVRNSGEITDWTAHVVHERDEWDYQEGDNPHIHHKPSPGIRGEVIAAYSIARYKTGEISREWMWREELDDARRMSKSEHGPWEDWEDEMYRKTVARRHAKVLPMSTDVEGMLTDPAPEEDRETARSLPPSTVREIPSINDALDMLSAPAARRRTRAPAEPVDDVPTLQGQGGYQDAPDGTGEATDTQGPNVA